uniref:Uncharacterized protein n=1 Tax=Aegilops tauschii subsp. strangulata TaxID=200361 RepID=A0A453KDY5_AEGTS
MLRSVDWEVLLLCRILYIEKQEIDETIEKLVKLLEVDLYFTDQYESSITCRPVQCVLIWNEVFGLCFFWCPILKS